MEELFNNLQNWAMNAGIKIIISIFLLIISFVIINKLSKTIERRISKLQEKKKIKMDQTIYRTLSYMGKIALKVIVVLSIVGYLGVDTSAISALLASLGVGIGLAINGTLSNLAGGILLLITRPFRDGDFISAGGYEGTVEDILICNTKIRTNDNKVIYIPNGKLSATEIVNYSQKPTRRVDLNYSVSYSDDFSRAQELILDTAKNNPLILDDPEPKARIKNHGESSIDIFATVWCKTEDYWTVFFDMNEQVKRAFDENGISIPFPQIDVHFDK